MRTRLLGVLHALIFISLIFFNLKYFVIFYMNLANAHSPSLTNVNLKYLYKKSEFGKIILHKDLFILIVL